MANDPHHTGTQFAFADWFLSKKKVDGNQRGNLPSSIDNPFTIINHYEPLESTFIYTFIY